MSIPVNNNNNNNNPLPPPSPPLTQNSKIPSNLLNMRIENFGTTKSLLDFKYKYGESVSEHFQKMKTHFDRLNDLGIRIRKEHTMHWILCSLPTSFVEFHMYEVDPKMTLMEFPDLLITTEATIQEVVQFINPTLAIDGGSAKRKMFYHLKGKGNGKV